MKKLKSKRLVSGRVRRSQVQNNETAFNLQVYEQFAKGSKPDTDTNHESDYKEIQESLLIPYRANS